MPLSEYEQRVLEQMEQQLRSDDPRLVDAISGQGARRPLNMAIGIILVIAGLLTLVGGVASSFIWLGFIGFVMMFGGVLLAMRRSDGPKLAGKSSKQAGKGRSAPQKQAFMDRMDERWEKRQRDQ